MCTSKSRHSRDAAPRPGSRLGWLLAGSLLLTSVLLGGCGRRELPVDAAVRHQTLLVSIPGEPSELDPHIINAPPDFDVIQAFFEGLVVAHPKTLQAQPGVAERWDVSDDRLNYTFHLREDARWSNGDAVTAHIQACFDKEAELTAAIMADPPTIEAYAEIDSAAWPPNA